MQITEDLPDASAARHASPRRPLSWWICLALGVVAAVVGLVPWFVTGMRLPAQLFWERPVTPETMPIVFIPFSQHAVAVLFGLIVTGSAVAGVTSRATRPWQWRAGQFWIVLGLLAVQILAAAHATLIVFDGLDRRPFTWLYVVVMVGVVVTSIVVGIPVLLLIADAPRAGATIGLSIASVAVAAWLGALLDPLSIPPVPGEAWGIGLMPWMPAILVGIALAWGGLNTVGRILAAPVCLAILWVLPTAATVVAESAINPMVLDRQDQLWQLAMEQLISGFRVSELTVQPVIVALVVAAVGLVVRALLRDLRRVSATLDDGRVVGVVGAAGGGEVSMQQRPLGRTGRDVSPIGLGTWQLGADWGAVSEEDAIAVLTASVDRGVTLFDTADVYGDGRSESLIGRFLADRPGHGITVATKMGRRAAQEPANYTPENFRAWTDRSRRNLGVDTLDLVQLHCPPTAVIEDAATYDALDALVADGTIAAYGVSVETCAQALAAIARPNVTNVQIIFNPFRLKPLDEVLPAAEAAGVSIFARVPLASGLLSGRYSESTTFAADDHRTYNRHGEAFDRGETFSGVEFSVGLEAVAELSAAVPEGVSLPAATLAWIASQPGVTSVIPGARSVAQATANADAARLLDGGFDGFDVAAFDAVVRDVYDRRLREAIHPLW